MQGVQASLDFAAPGPPCIAATGFTDSSLRLATDSDDAAVVRRMVEVAQARGWRALRITGSLPFCRQAWIEARLRGLPTQGFEPDAGDWAALSRAGMAVEAAGP